MLIRHDHAEALIVLHLFGPDDAVRIDSPDDRQVGVEQRIDKDHDDRSVDIWARQVHRARGSVEYFLFNEASGNVVVLAHVSLDFFLQMAGDDNQLLELPGPAQRVHHVVHHRPPRDVHERFGNALRQRQKARAFACHWHDDFHGTRP